MDKAALLRLIDAPELLTETDLESLEEMAATYPYFQIPHLLIAKYTHDKKSMLAPQKIRRAALYAYNRNRLRHFIQNSAPLGREDLQLKTHFEQVDNATLKITRELDEETVPGLPNAEAENETAVSFFDNLDFDDPGREKFSDTQAEPSETRALELHNEGQTEASEQMYQQLARLYPEKAAYFYRQLAILTDKEIYLQLAAEAEAQPLPNAEVQPFFENIAKENAEDADAQASRSFFDGIELPEEEIAPLPEKIVPPLKPELLDLNQVEENPETFFEALARAEGESFFGQERLPETEDAFTLLQREGEAPQQISEETPAVASPLQTDTKASFFDEFDQEEELPADLNRLPNENQAVLLFNQGKTQEAIQVYEQLLERNPQKASYYLSQINVLKSNLAAESEPSPKKNTPPASSTSWKEHPEEETIDERLAIELFNEGKVEEAVAVYEKLMRCYPEKQSYFRQQIEILKS
ncbi:MAG: hypothetical protein OHK0053_30640 [Microscillaceae bacterium]